MCCIAVYERAHAYRRICREGERGRGQERRRKEEEKGDRIKMGLDTRRVSMERSSDGRESEAAAAVQRVVDKCG